jgi:hypothetical protein
LDGEVVVLEEPAPLQVLHANESRIAPGSLDKARVPETTYDNDGHHTSVMPW